MANQAMRNATRTNVRSIPPGLVIPIERAHVIVVLGLTTPLEEMKMMVASLPVQSARGRSSC